MHEVDHQLLDALDEAACVADAGGVILRHNDAFTALFGRPARPGETLDEFLTTVPWHDSRGRPVPFAETPVARALHAGAAVAGVEADVERAGGPGTVRVATRAVRDDDGRTRAVLCLLEDVTERRRADAALSQYRQFVDQIHDGIIATDLEGRVTYWSRGAERLYGYPAADAIGRHVSFLYAPDDVHRLQRDVLDPLFAKGEHTVEKRARRKTGEMIIVHLALSVLRDAGGAVTGAVGYSMDVTARRHSEEALRANEEWLRLALATGRMRAWDWNLATDELVWSDPPHDVIDGTVTAGRAFLAAVHPDDRAGVQRAIAHLLANGGPLLQQCRMIFRDGSVHWVAATAGVVHGARGLPVRVIGVARDITEQKAVETEREALLIATERARADAEAASRSKDEFLAMLGHELRNPLAASRNAVVAAQFDPRERERALDIARRQMDQLARLVDDLLDVARITTGRIRLHRERVRLADVVAAAVESSRPALEDRGHTLRVAAAHDLELVADRARLEQVLVNLLDNAVKYTPPGGHIEVAAGRDDDTVVIRVRDDGEGIVRDILPRIFDLFTQSPQTLDRARGGLGLGLTLVKRLVTLHDGTITVHSAGQGQGTEFVVRLPAARRAPGDAPAAAAERRARARLRILVVEDNPDAAESLNMVLQSLGHDVRVVYHGLAALESVRERVPDVILLDIGLPGIDGYEVARRLRQRPELAHVVLIAVTGYGREEDRARSAAAGFTHHLVKPFDLEELQAELARIGGRAANGGEPDDSRAPLP
jgi:PAS domain S-box-containing protein